MTGPRARSSYRMEFFYREMRRKTGLLLDEEGNPEGGKWNYDSENRKPAKRDLMMPQPIRFRPDEVTQEVISLVRKRFSESPWIAGQFPFCDHS